MRIVIGISHNPKSVLLNGKKLDFVQTKVDKIELYPNTDGTLEIVF